MSKKNFSKLVYYLRLAFKKPKLILSFIFKKHLGVILSMPIQVVENSKSEKNFNIVNSKSKKKIYLFYKRMNRSAVNYEVIGEWLDKGFECFLVQSSEEQAVGAMWIFKDEFFLNSLSGRTLSTKKKIKLDSNTIYGAYVIIDEKYRGRGINQLLLTYVINYYSKKSVYKNLLLITGASNGAYIRTMMKHGAKLIGITEVINIFGFKKRREIFLDRKEKMWNLE